MALPDYFKAKVDYSSAFVWGPSGATGGSITVTNAMNLDALASASARQGVYADLGSGEYYDEWVLWAMVETGTSPTAGAGIDIYLAWSPFTGTFPGRAAGTDSSYSASRDNLDYVTSIRAEAVSNTVIQGIPTLVRPKGRYVCPVLYNGSGQAIRNQTTDSDNLSRIILMPKQALIAD
jgi:hypothetical protein